MFLIIILLFWGMGYHSAGYYSAMRPNEINNPHSQKLSHHYYGYPEEITIKLTEEAIKEPWCIFEKNPNPAEITWTAQLLWERYMYNSNDSLAYRRFLQYAQWLKENITVDKSCYGCWKYNFPIKRTNINLSPGWVSALSQGHGISVLAKAFQLSGDSSYIKAAFLALEPFKRTVFENGVLRPEIRFYEEYPTKPEGTYVLNGFISSLLGIYDLFRITRDTTAFRLYNDGLMTLKIILPKYDIGFWSRYSLTKKRNIQNRFDISSPFYHRLHIVQLISLYNLTGHKDFLFFAMRWEKEESSGWAFLWENLFYIYKGAKNIREFYFGRKAFLFSPVS